MNRKISSTALLTCCVCLFATAQENSSSEEVDNRLRAGLRLPESVPDGLPLVDGFIPPEILDPPAKSLADPPEIQKQEMKRLNTYLKLCEPYGYTLKRLIEEYDLQDELQLSPSQLERLAEAADPVPMFIHQDLAIGTSSGNAFAFGPERWAEFLKQFKARADAEFAKSKQDVEKILNENQLLRARQIGFQLYTLVYADPQKAFGFHDRKLTTDEMRNLSQHFSGMRPRMMMSSQVLTFIEQLKLVESIIGVDTIRQLTGTLHLFQFDVTEYEWAQNMLDEWLGEPPFDRRTMRRRVHPPIKHGINVVQLSLWPRIPEQLGLTRDQIHAIGAIESHIRALNEELKGPKYRDFVGRRAEIEEAMRELGEASDAAHENVLELLTPSQADRVLQLKFQHDVLNGQFPAVFAAAGVMLDEKTQAQLAKGRAELPLTVDRLTRDLRLRLTKAALSNVVTQDQLDQLMGEPFSFVGDNVVKPLPPRNPPRNRSKTNRRRRTG